MAAGKCDEKLLAAILAFYPCKSFLEIAAFKKLIDGRTDDLSPKTILFLVPLRIYFLKVIEILLNDTEKRRGGRISRPIERRLLMKVVAHCGPTFRVLSILPIRAV